MEIYILYLKCWMAVMIGLSIHTGLKYDSTLKLYRKAKEEFSFTKYLIAGKVSHVINLLCCIFWMLILHDAITIYPKIEMWLTILSGPVGFANSSLVIKLFGVGQKYILDKIDVITNADLQKQPK